MTNPERPHANRGRGNPDPARVPQPPSQPDDTPLPSAPTLGRTPRAADFRRPDLDEYGLPVPNRALEREGATVFRSRVARGFPPPPSQPGAPRRRWSAGSCLVRLAVASIFLIAGLGITGVAAAGIAYYSIAAALPSVEDLQARASQFETMRLYDRDGNLIYEIDDPNAGRRTRVPLSRISPILVAATIATEDREFYTHPGFDPLAIVRAIWQNTREGETVSGASTITQQLTRTLLFDPEERQQRTTRRKIREIILAAEITRRYTKDEILELYLNEIYYGNRAYGIEAAAEIYFDTTAAQLTLAQASFLAGLPQAPSVYDVYANRDAALHRQLQVLTGMVEAGCVEVSNSVQPVCVTPEQAGVAAAEIANYQFTPPAGDSRYPHWANYVRSLLEAEYGAQFIHRSGYNVTTTLSAGLQDLAQQTVADQVNALAEKHVTNGALVAIRPTTGEILAMVGSKDFNDEVISGQINMALAPRQPGSSIKPLTYVAAFELGWTPASLLWDVPSKFPPSGRPDDTRPPYEPVNYDGKHHGPVLLRPALANSYNIPAVKALDFVGIYDDPATERREGLIAFAERLGVTSLTAPDYGLALTLGGGEVPLLEMTGAYSVFANGGVRVPPVAILKITNSNGDTVYEYAPPPGEQAVRPEHAYLMTSILSDNAARTPAFGPNSALKLSFPAAVKTGTTNDYRDNWTIGYTPDLTVGVWVGNADYTPMQGTSGLTGAAPIWHNMMEAAMPVLPGAPTPFARPATVVDRTVCALSGAEPSEWCGNHTTEIFALDQPPLPKEQDLWHRVYIDRFTGLRASAQCPDNYDEKVMLNIGDPFAREWVTAHPAGQAWASAIGFPPPVIWPPDAECTAETPQPILSIDYPYEGNSVSGLVDIWGRAAMPLAEDFDRYLVEYGLSHNPIGWATIAGPSNTPITEITKLAELNTASLPNGPATVRVLLFSRQGGSVERRVHLMIDNPTPVPAPASDTPAPTFAPVADTATPDASATLSPLAETVTPQATP